VLFALQVVASPAAAQPAGPTPQALADQLRLEMVQALERRDYAAVLERAETYRALQSEGVAMPAGLYFAEAEAAKESGDWLRARGALAAYLERADPKDPLYPEALAMGPVIEAEIARQHAEQERTLREAQEAERRAREEREAAERRRLLDELVGDLVTIPAGRFRMGDHSKRGDEDELPVHRVDVASFMLGRHEVTFEQYDAFCAASGRECPDDRGWGRGRRPVMNVSYEDALAFLAWAGEQTGQRLRLPTEAEWEYAARAGSETDYWWGDAWSPDHANAAGTGGRDRWQATAPVGEFPANPFGLHDTSGNVREWVQDCWSAGYPAKAGTAAARTDGDCSRRVVRGGSWNLGPAWQRSANRDFDDRTYRYVDRGFRVARDLQ
jgi:formylglycine-generating enzyme required for sulfatase activity